MVLVGAHAFLPPFREAARTAPAGSAPQVGRGRGGRVCRPRQWQRSRRRGRSSDPMTGPASAVVRRVPCPPRTRLGGSSPPQRRLADHVAHEPRGARPSTQDRRTQARPGPEPRIQARRAQGRAAAVPCLQHAAAQWYYRYVATAVATKVSAAAGWTWREAAH